MSKNTKTQPAQLTAQELAHKLKWRRISLPTPWYPSVAGEELVGYYGGTTVRDGQFGQYQVIFISVPYKGTFVVSGTLLVQQAAIANLVRGQPVRLVFFGLKSIGENRMIKDIGLYVSDEVHATDMPPMELELVP